MKNTLFSKQLRKALYEKGLTQKELAKMIVVQKPMISRWVTGDRTPNFGSLQKIANALNLPLSYFNQNVDIKDICSEQKSSNNKSSRLEILEEKVKRLEAEIELIKEKSNKKK